MAHKQILKDILHTVIPAIVSVILVAWLFHKVDIKTVIFTLKAGCDYWWLLLMILVLVLSRSVRGVRWGLQLRAAGVPRMPKFAEMVSIYGAYALNLVFTGVGEAWRCIYVARRQKASLSTVIGTDLGDRISDAIVIVCLVVCTLFVARPALDRFFDHYPLGRELSAIFTSPWFLMGLIIIIGGILWLGFTHSDNRTVDKIKTECSRLWVGFKVLFTMPHQFEYWGMTLLIWIFYFLMTYLCFFAFPFTKALVTPEMAYGLLPGLVVFVFGSLSIAVPATGGLGPWNIAVIFALTLYGVDQADAATYSMVVWAFQTIAQILLGVVAAIYVAISRRKVTTT
ncbi:MAG: flippase-like domain-containing protein [Bacteroidales bacterium]|nr:flippase-like domain-containing protein [Bacteroidales bacterium]